MTYCVYILYSGSQDSFYKGQTSNISERLDRHNGGIERYTKTGIPWKLVWSTRKNTRSEAVLLERKLKNLSRSRTIGFILKYSEGISSPDELLLMKQLSGC